MFGSFGTLLLLAGTMPTALPVGLRIAIDAENNHRVAARLETLLQAWDKANQNARELHYTVQWTTEDRVLKDKTIRQVEAFIKKPKFCSSRLEG